VICTVLNISNSIEVKGGEKEPIDSKGLSIMLPALNQKAYGSAKNAGGGRRLSVGLPVKEKSKEIVGKTSLILLFVSKSPGDRI